MKRSVRKQLPASRYSSERYTPERYRSSRRRRLIGSIVIVCSLLVVVHSTLSPYQFDLSDAGVAKAQSRIAQLLQKPQINRAFWIDICRNVLFFLPLGIGLGCRLSGNLSNPNSEKIQPSFYAASIQFLIVSFALSAVVEILQLFEPSRHTSLFDLLCNTTGGILGGWLLFYQWQWRQSLSFPPIRAAITIGLLVFLLYAPHRSTSLQSWNETYQLTVGNEASENRPWRGKTNGFSLLARAASEQEIKSFLESGMPIQEAIASYRFDRDAEDKSAVVVRSPQSAPPLSWKGNPTVASRSISKINNNKSNDGKFAHSKPAEQQDQNVSINPKRWLITDIAPTDLTSTFKQNSAFSLTTQITSAKVKQFGPATIISLSKDPSNRNFTLGQNGTDLVFRLATIWTGQNGTWPEFVVPDVFLPDDLSTHNLVVTYQNPQLAIYVDDIAQVHQLNISPRQTWLWTGLNLLRPTQNNYWRALSGTSALFQASRTIYWTVCFLLAVVSILSLISIAK